MAPLALLIHLRAKDIEIFKLMGTIHKPLKWRREVGEVTEERHDVTGLNSSFLKAVEINSNWDTAMLALVRDCVRGSLQSLADTTVSHLEQCPDTRLNWTKPLLVK